jgi:hypothetical protein
LPCYGNAAFCRNGGDIGHRDPLAQVRLHNGGFDPRAIATRVCNGDAGRPLASKLDRQGEPGRRFGALRAPVEA